MAFNFLLNNLLNDLKFNENYRLNISVAQYIFKKYKNDNGGYIEDLDKTISSLSNNRDSKIFIRHYKKCLCKWFEIDYLLNKENNNNSRKDPILNLNTKLDKANAIINELIQQYNKEVNLQLKEQYLEALRLLKEYYDTNLAHDIKQTKNHEIIEKSINNTLSDVFKNESKKSNYFWTPLLSGIGAIALTALVIIAILTNIITFGIPALCSAIIGAAVCGIICISTLVSNRRRNKSSSKKNKGLEYENINIEEHFLEIDNENRLSNNHKNSNILKNSPDEMMTDEERNRIQKNDKRTINLISDKDEELSAVKIEEQNSYPTTKELVSKLAKENNEKIINQILIGLSNGNKIHYSDLEKMIEICPDLKNKILKDKNVKQYILKRIKTGAIRDGKEQIFENAPNVTKESMKYYSEINKYIINEIGYAYPSAKVFLQNGQIY